MGGRKGATALVVFLMISVLSLSGWAFYIPLRDSVSNLSEVLPEYWERLQKPLIKMEQHAKRSEIRMQAEVTTEITNAAENNEMDESENSPEPEPTNSPADSSTLRSSLAQMLGAVVGSMTNPPLQGC